MFFRRKKLSETEFANKFAKALQKKVKGVTILSVSNLDIVTSFTDSEERRHFLDNAYSEYSRDIKSIKDVIERYVQSSCELYTPKEPLKSERIIPVIKDARYLNGLAELGSQVEEHLYEPYNSELYIFYAEDSELTTRYLTKPDQEDLGLSIDELRETAVNNLNRFDIRSHGEEGYYMITAGGTYEASMILLDIWNKDNFDVNGEIVIGVPARDLLVVTGSRDSAHLHKMYDLVNEISETGNYLVSDKLFEWKGDRFEVMG